MEEAKENLIELNQESIIIIMQLSEVFEKVQRSFELINSTMDVNKQVTDILKKPGKNCHSVEKLIPTIVDWSGKLTELNNILFNYTATLKTRTQNVQHRLLRNKDDLSNLSNNQ